MRGDPEQQSYLLHSTSSVLRWLSVILKTHHLLRSPNFVLRRLSVILKTHHIVLDRCTVTAVTIAVFWIFVLLLLSQQFGITSLLTATMPLPLCSMTTLVFLSFCILQYVLFFKSSPFFPVNCNADPHVVVLNPSFTCFINLCLVMILFEEVIDVIFPSLFWSSNHSRQDFV